MLSVIEQILEYLKGAAIVINLFGVVVIIVGFALSAWRYASRFKKIIQEGNHNLFKVELGGSLLLGLEILILAEVIETITVTPTLQSLAILAAIVVVRAAVSWNLTLTVKGCWPWQVIIEDQEDA